MAGIEEIILHLADNSSPPQKDRWAAVVRQAVRHTREVMPYDLLKDQRPNESDYIREYRLKNYRYFTNEGVIKFNDKSSRIISRTNYAVINESTDLENWTIGYDFQLGNGESASLNDYFSRYILPSSFEDPNAILVSFPYNADNPDISPSAPISDGGLPPNEQISIKVCIIESDRIHYVSNNGFAYYGGEWGFKDRDGVDKFKPFYWACDSFAWYRVYPTGYETDKKGRTRLKYEHELWYVHDTGIGEEMQVPLNVLGGTITKMPADSRVSYYESYLKPYFEYADEAICTFSDFQAVRVQNAYPVKVMTRRPCQKCNGSGKVKVSGSNGFEVSSCGTCDGSGVEAGLSPFKDLIVDDSDGIGQKGSKREPLSFVSPDTAILEFMNRAWMQMIADARKSINLDVLTDVSESGRAKEVRLEDLQDMLGKIGGNMFEVMERMLWFNECLLQPNRNMRQVPMIIRPVSYDIKSETVLQEEAKNAHPADAVTALMNYYRKRYAGDDRLIRIKELALSYAPLLAITNPQELQLRLMGAYSDADIIKRDRAEWAISRIAKDVDIFDERIEGDVFRRADEIIRPFLPPERTPLI